MAWTSPYVDTPARRTALVGRAREGHFQARPHDVPLFASDRHHGTSPITSLQPSKLHRDIGYVPPTDTSSLCLAVDSTHTVVPGLFRLLVRRSGTHCQMNSEIRRVMSTVSNSSLKQSCSAVTSVTSALEVIFNVMRSINPRFTYLLTFYHSHIHIQFIPAATSCDSLCVVVSVLHPEFYAHCCAMFVISTRNRSQCS